MELFSNLVYEYKKGMRDLALYTCKKEDREKFTQYLEKTDTDFLILKVGDGKINIFFGCPECLDILNNFSDTELDKLTPQEDFILGIMLGYSRREQYSRILSKLVM